MKFTYTINEVWPMDAMIQVLYEPENIPPSSRNIILQPDFTIDQLEEIILRSAPIGEWMRYVSLPDITSIQKGQTGEIDYEPPPEVSGEEAETTWRDYELFRANDVIELLEIDNLPTDEWKAYRTSLIEYTEHAEFPNNPRPVAPDA